MFKSCLVYLDEVIIFSNNADEHIKHVDEILTTLVDDGVTFNISKCLFFQQEVEHIGHMGKLWSLEICRTIIASLRDA